MSLRITRNMDCSGDSHCNPPTPRTDASPSTGTSSKATRSFPEGTSTQPASHVGSSVRPAIGASAITETNIRQPPARVNLSQPFIDLEIPTDALFPDPMQTDVDQILEIMKDTDWKQVKECDAVLRINSIALIAVEDLEGFFGTSDISASIMMSYVSALAHNWTTDKIALIHIDKFQAKMTPKALDEHVKVRSYEKHCPGMPILAAPPKCRQSLLLCKCVVS